MAVAPGPVPRRLVAWTNGNRAAPAWEMVSRQSPGKLRLLASLATAVTALRV